MRVFVRGRGFRLVPALLLLVIGMVRETPAQSTRPITTAPTAIDAYVAKPDSSYRWKVVHTAAAEGVTTYVVDMTSQTWRDKHEVNQPEWQHWLVVSKPDGATLDTAMLFIAGGKNGGQPPTKPDARMMKLAVGSQSVVATLLMVPNQPLVFRDDGQERTEDDLVAYTWVQYLKTGDGSWPARNPMVKSAVRAMDTITALMKSKAGGGLKVDKFVVAGGSKRGWTTWITAAIDRRVVAIAPIVIDVLNVEASMRHHYAAYGFWAPAVGDYVHHRIFSHLDHPRMDRLLDLVDPYMYRDRLTMPKFIINAAGDQFFLPDSSRFYFDKLKGEKLLRYVPNADHSLEGSDAIESLLAFYAMVLHHMPRPRYSWSFESDDAIRVHVEDTPARVLLWQATNPDARDFRLESLGKKYTSTVLSAQKNGDFVGEISPPARGWTAYFVELTYDIGQRVPLKVTSAVRITPDTLPFADKDPTKSLDRP